MGLPVPGIFRPGTLEKILALADPDGRLVRLHTAQPPACRAMPTRWSSRRIGGDSADTANGLQQAGADPGPADQQERADRVEGRPPVRADEQRFGDVQGERQQDRSSSLRAGRNAVAGAP
ncbi:hypothetical protein [Streptomyces sp. 4N124]|uniref:hypothetical protein n=1 Tax=Streptomyces sp. 4N124 TaxID=3457420 RepID=UPI003FD27BEB